MPTIPLMKLPRTKSEKEFERMVKDMFASMYQSESQLYGRPGQPQGGIDVYINMQGIRIGVQCKNYLGDMKANDFCRVIDQEIAKLNQKNLTINEFYIVTALDRDVVIQNYVENKECANIILKVLFWDDIEQWICSDIKLLKYYYPDFFNDISQQMISLFELAFIGNQISSLIALMLGDRPETAKLCDVLMNGLIWFKNLTTQQRYLANLTALREYVDGPINLFTNIKNEPVYSYCNEIEGCVQTILGTLNLVERPYYLAGSILATFSKQLDVNKENVIIREDCISYFYTVISKFNLSAEALNCINEKVSIMRAPDVPNELNARKYSMPFEIYDYLRMQLGL